MLKVFFLKVLIFQADDFDKIADLPSKEESLTKFVFMLKSPIQNFANLLSSPMVNLVNVLKCFKNSKKIKKIKIRSLKNGC